ncbi:unnamed protein product [Calypogeia fissa]
MAVRSGFVNGKSALVVALCLGLLIMELSQVAEANCDTLVVAKVVIDLNESGYAHPSHDCCQLMKSPQFGDPRSQCVRNCLGLLGLLDSVVDVVEGLVVALNICITLNL